MSVVVPAFDAAGSIDRALASLLAQTLTEIEILVVDDASGDDTAARVAAMARRDDRIILLRANRNGGPGMARNIAVARARGRWIAFLDADDAFLPDRLARLVAAAGHAGLDMIADNLLLFDATAGRPVRPALDDLPDAPIVPLDAAGFLARCVPGRGFDLGQLKPLVSRRFVERARLRFADTRHGEDFGFWMDALLAGAVAGLVTTPHYVFTERRGSLSRMPSPWSRTRIDHAGLQAQGSALLTRVEDRPELARLVRARLAGLALLARDAPLHAALGERKPAAVLAALLRNPRGCSALTARVGAWLGLHR